MNQTTNKPKTALITRYSANGKDQALISRVSFAQAEFGVEGSLSGGILFHQASTPENRSVSSANLTLQKDGKPSSAETQINGRFSDDRFKTVNTDLSSLHWTNGGRIHSGEIQVRTKHAKGKQTSGSLVFDQERLVSGSFTHHSEQGVHGYTEVDYSTIQFLGAAVVGGHFSVTRKRPDKGISSQSKIVFNDTGRVDKIHTTNFASNASSVRSKVVSDYAGIRFNARNEVASGDLHCHVTDQNDNRLSHTQVSYKDQVPLRSVSHRYQGTNVVKKVVVDFSEAKFSDNYQIVNSSTKVKVYDRDEQIQSSQIIHYDSEGNIFKKEPLAPELEASQTFESEDESLMAISSLDSIESETNAVEEETDKTHLDSPTENQRSNTEITSRPDGTMEKSVTTTFVAEEPVSLLVKHYDISGKIVIKTYTIDLQNLKYESNATNLLGSLSLQKRIGGETLHSEIILTY